MGTARVEFQSVGRGQRTSTSVKEQVNWCSLAQAHSRFGMQPLEQTAAKPRAVVAGWTTFALLSQAAHAPSRMRSAPHTIEKWRGSMKCSPGDVPLPLRLELKSVVVLSIAFVRTFSWRWPVVLSSPLGHSGAQYATPGLAFKSPPVGLMYAHFTTFGVHSTIRRSGAQSHAAKSGPEGERGSHCLGNHPCLFHPGALLRPFPRIIVMTLEGCFCERVSLIVSLNLLLFLSRGCLVKCSMRLDPFDLFHVGPVLVSIGGQQNPCVHLVGCQLFLKREAPDMVDRFAIDHKTGVTRRHLQSQS